MNEMAIWVRQAGERRQVAVLQGLRLMEYYEEARPSLVGAVLLGRVERVLPQVGAAFVNIGGKKNGFLPLKEMESFEHSGQAQPLVTGRELAVQVKKDAKEEKGPFLTRDIALPGQYCVYMPMNRHVGVSGRVTEEGERVYAQALGRELAEGRGGIILRHAALSARPPDVREEYEALAARWREILERAPFVKAPGVLYQETDLVEALRRDYAARFAVSVVQGGENATDAEMDALWRRACLPRQLEEALARQVNLPGGGTLVVDEREALTTIDVNTARFTGEKGEDVAFSQDLAACGEIARQIRLRNLGGIVLIDFIDMKTDAQRRQVWKTLESALAEDRVKTAVHGFTSLGLLEMTRKRARETLRDAQTEPCERCGGAGRRPRKV